MVFGGRWQIFLFLQDVPAFAQRDPDGNRTHVTTVKGWCLSRLTTGPVSFESAQFSDTFAKKIVALLSARQLSIDNCPHNSIHITSLLFRILTHITVYRANRDTSLNQRELPSSFLHQNPKIPKTYTGMIPAVVTRHSDNFICVFFLTLIKLLETFLLPWATDSSCSCYTLYFYSLTANRLVWCFATALFRLPAIKIWDSSHLSSERLLRRPRADYTNIV